MGVGRLAPYRVRARYAKALKEIPLPVRSFNGVDPDALTTIAETEIGGRKLRFGVLYAIPRLWVTFPEHLPPVLGFITGFDRTIHSAAFNTAFSSAASVSNSAADSAADSGADGDARLTELHVTGLDHLEWVRHSGRSRLIKQAAIASWAGAQRVCDG